MHQITYQPELRPALPSIFGCKDYTDERNLFIKIDEILVKSGIEQKFVELSVKQKKLKLHLMSEAQTRFFMRSCHMALRGNIARTLKKLPHREFCKLLPDSTLLRWFVGVEHVDCVKAYAKSTSDRFAHWLNEESLQQLNQMLISSLAAEGFSNELGLAEEIEFGDVYFDSTCLKADIHYPVDWVLLRDLTRTLMKATVIVRREGLRHRMPQEPLEFLSDINSLAMRMTASGRVKDGKRKRKEVLRSMKTLIKKVRNHAHNHLRLLEHRGHETDLSFGELEQLKRRLQNVLKQIKPALDQAHERIIGERKIKNEDKILSIYDGDVEVIARGKAQAKVEFGNKMWLGETQQGLIVDYLLEENQTADSKHVMPSLKRLKDYLDLPVERVWGDRGLDSKTNAKQLSKQGVYNGLCPKGVSELANRLEKDPQLSRGLKRRAGIEARISILLKNFMGNRDKPRAKGFEHRQMMVGWGVFSHNLWVLARLPQKKPDNIKAAV